MTELKFVNGVLKTLYYNFWKFNLHHVYVVCGNILTNRNVSSKTEIREQ